MDFEEYCDKRGLFRTSDFRDMWDAATKAERAACAKLCSDEANKQWGAFEAEKTDYLEGRADSADFLAQKLRSNDLAKGRAESASSD